MDWQLGWPLCAIEKAADNISLQTLRECIKTLFHIDVDKQIC